MEQGGSREAAVAAAVRRHLETAARCITDGRGTLHERLVAAWWHLRSLYPNASPGQVGLTPEQRAELARILDALGDRRGAAANAPAIRKVPMERALRAAERLRRLVGDMRATSTAVPAPTGATAPTAGAPPS